MAKEITKCRYCYIEPIGEILFPLDVALEDGWGQPTNIVIDFFAQFTTHQLYNFCNILGDGYGDEVHGERIELISFLLNYAAEEFEEIEVEDYWKHQAIKYLQQETEHELGVIRDFVEHHWCRQDKNIVNREHFLEYAKQNNEHL